MNDDVAAALPIPSPGRFGFAGAWILFGGYLGGQVAGAMAVGFAGGIIGGVRAAITGTPVDTPALVRDLGAWMILGAVLGGAAVLFPLSHFLIRHRAGETYRSAIGWAAGEGRHRLVTGLAGAVFGGIYLAFSIWVLPPPADHEPGPVAQMASTVGGRLLWTLVALGIPPVEEFLFRGAFYSGLVRRWSPRLSALVVSVVFFALHYGEVGGYLPGMLAIAALTLATIVLRMRTGCVGPSLALHWSYNTVLVISVWVLA
ncbi:MAG: CPBP family intramembrane metalloprotease [Planctomycetes bacterium]|nr:CPBP family intramembrane metalloprotease [Planctomycetota bacterium]